MTQISNAKPIWLDLKKEYVDDNFEALLSYLASNHNSFADPFYNTTLGLVRERVDDVLESISQRPVYSEDIPEDEAVFNVRLLTCYLLIYPAAENSLKALLAIVYNLRLLVPKYADELIGLVGKCLRHDRIERPGVSYKDIIDFKKEIFAHKLSLDSKFSSPVADIRLSEANGRLWQMADGFVISAPGERSQDEKPGSLTFSLDTGSGCKIGTFKGDKLSTSETGKFGKVADFITKFLKAQAVPLGKPKLKKRLSYSPDDAVVLRVTDVYIDSTNPQNIKSDISVETTDPDYQHIEGHIVYSGPFIGVYTTAWMAKYFHKGDFVRAHVVDPDKGTFSFEKDFRKFLVEDTKSEYGVDSTMYAELISHVSCYFNWIGENGATINTFSKDGIELHDLARLRITKFEYGKNYGKINATIEEKVTQDDIFEDYNQEFNCNQIREDAMRTFIEDTPKATVDKSDDTGYKPVDISLLPYILRIFYAHQRTLPDPVERLRYLGNAMALSGFIEDMPTLRFLQFSASYLRAIVSFAANDNIHDIELPDVSEFADSGPVKSRYEILELLKEYGKSGDSQKLKEAITSGTDDKPLIPQLARLIVAANSIRETLSAATLNALKREIIRNLSIETEEDVEIDSDTRPHLGSESQTVEFKTSLVFPPDNNMQPNLTLQSDNIFKGICGFLNSSIGGTMYIGVNDQGYVTGLTEDFRYLKCQSFDTYARRHIMDPLIKLCGKDIMTYVHIDSGFDDSVAIIRVEPFPFGVVEMKGIAYIRVDRETRQMTDRVKAQITHEKLLKDKEQADNLRKLQQAMYTRRKAILHGYASSNGGTISDREVEVYEVHPEDGLVACLDCSGNSCKFFGISRIGYVEITDRPWKNSHLHKKMNLDSFRISGEQSHPVSLQLDLHAKNVMVERYPRTKDDIVKDPNDTNVWYYTSRIAGIDVLARFYAGLADHIKILDAPTLTRAVDEYVKKYLVK